MKTIGDFSELQIDALKEVANISGSHAANALFSLLKKQITMQVPKVLAGNLEEVIFKIAGPHDAVVSLVFQFRGGLKGKTLVIYPRQDALHLASMPMRGDRKDGIHTQNMRVNEISSIIACAYMNAIGNIVDMVLIPSIPGTKVDIVSDSLSDVIHSFGVADDFVFCIVTECKVEDTTKPLHAYFVFLPDTDSLELILEKLQLEE